MKKVTSIIKVTKVYSESENFYKNSLRNNTPFENKVNVVNKANKKDLLEKTGKIIDVKI